MGLLPHISGALLLLPLVVLGAVAGPRAMRRAARHWLRLHREKLRRRLEAAYADYDPA